MEKTGFLSTFFSNPKFETRVDSTFWGTKSKVFFFYTFLRISPRKINIFKKPKMELIESTKSYKMNKNQLQLNFVINYKNQGVVNWDI